MNNNIQIRQILEKQKKKMRVHHLEPTAPCILQQEEKNNYIQFGDGVCKIQNYNKLKNVN